MYHLPAYVALQRWVAGRNVVVVGPRSMAGLEGLVTAGPHRLVLVAAPERLSVEPRGGRRFQCVDDLSDRSLSPGSVDIVACFETYASMTKTQRGALTRRAHELLRSGGFFAAGLPQDEDASLDFWAFEEELAARFEAVRLLAEMPWHGVSLAPVLDDPQAGISLDLDESLLTEPPPTAYYLAVAARDSLSPDLERWITQRCVMVPVPQMVPPAPLADDGELEQLKLEARQSATDVAVLTRTVHELEESVQRLRRSEDTLRSEVEQRRQEASELQAKHQAGKAERDNLSRQLEVTIADREAARQVATRIEAELDLARRRMADQETRLRERAEEVTKVSSELAVVTTRLEHQTSLLEASKLREEELSTSAAEGVERSRALSEVAQDRDRLREELTRRSGRLRELEERLWASRDEVQQERLETVRLGGEVERLRERLDRHQQVEQRQNTEIERLSAELHRLELESVTAKAQLEVRERELERLTERTEPQGEHTDELQALREDQVRRASELAEVRAQLEPLRVQETEARTRAEERRQQLDEVRAELDRMREILAERESARAKLESDLEVRVVEIEQNAGTIRELKEQLDQERDRAERAEVRESEMQRELERRAAEQQGLRDRLRERDQAFDELVSAGEANEVELFKLRHDLETVASTRENPIAESDAARVPPPPSDVPTEIAPGTDSDKVRRLQLEIEVRAQEQEYLLSLLDAAEQKIWEMNDASDRTAARLAAGLAQLENHKEQLAETQDELEVTRKLLAAAQARALEQERLLASERAKLARLGAGGGGAPSLNDAARSTDDVDQLFAELELGEAKMVSLTGATHRKPTAPVVDAAPSQPLPATGAPTPVADPGSGKAPRVVVEALEDAEWPED